MTNTFTKERFRKVSVFDKKCKLFLIPLLFCTQGINNCSKLLLRPNISQNLNFQPKSSSRKVFVRFLTMRPIFYLSYTFKILCWRQPKSGFVSNPTSCHPLVKRLLNLNGWVMCRCIDAPRAPITKGSENLAIYASHP